MKQILGLANRNLKFDKKGIYLTQRLPKCTERLISESNCGWSRRKLGCRNSHHAGLSRDSDLTFRKPSIGLRNYPCSTKSYHRLSHDLQKFNCRTNEEKLLCLYDVGIIFSANCFTSLIITVSPLWDHPPIWIRAIVSRLWWQKWMAYLFLGGTRRSLHKLFWGKLVAPPNLLPLLFCVEEPSFQILKMHLFLPLFSMSSSWRNLMEHWLMNKSICGRSSDTRWSNVSWRKILKEDCHWFGMVGLYVTTINYWWCKEQRANE